MSYRPAAGTLMVLGLIVSSTPSFAMSGLGCPELPAFYRAVGTIENGPGTCGMSTEEARRILARGDNGEMADAQAAMAARPVPRKHHRKTHHP